MAVASIRWRLGERLAMGEEYWPGTAVVTGAGGGLGRAVSSALACGGSHVVLVGRDKGTLEVTLASVKKAGGSGAIIAADFTDRDAVRNAAREIDACYPSIDVLVNNAGIMGVPRATTGDGHEMHLAVNYLSHFLLTGLLVRALKENGSARIVNVTSSHEGLSKIDWTDPHFATRPYDKFDAYTQSKSACLLHALALDRRLGRCGVRAFAVAPGIVNTGLFRNLTRTDLRAMIARIPAQTRRAGVPIRSVEEGAQTIVWAATAPELAGHGGQYCMDCAFAPVPETVGGPAEAERLWSMSEGWVGHAFDW
jgi:NAD(P)-dependent dehydrogenase (short-subunit alcohol dehydrogenase family)